MLRKIISIRNVGRFLSSAAPGNPDLARHTLVVGANGFGKTTLCAVLRSLQSGDPAHILGRRTLGIDGPPSVEVLLRDGVARFADDAWSTSYPAVAIYDGVFVAENVHSGEVVEIDHRRNLYRVIIGEAGVRLAEEEMRLAALSRAKTGEISTASKAVQPHLPAGMGLDAFIALPDDPDIDARIAEQEGVVKAVRQARQINERAPLGEITLPTLPEAFFALLARTIDDIAQDAERRLAEHLTAHGMEADGGNWIAEGLQHAEGGTCPFCGQDIQGLPLIAAYRAVFSARYQDLRDEIRAMRDDIAERFGEGAVGRLNTLIEQNKGHIEFWSQYCSFDAEAVALPADIPETVQALGQTALALLEHKARAPLERIQPDSAFDAAAAAYEAARGQGEEILEAIRGLNTLIARKKEETGGADVHAAEAELARRKAVKARHSDPVAGQCADYVRLTGEKNAIDLEKEEVRARLEEHTKKIMRPYEERINRYLDIFNAGFQIAETKHGYPGGTAASSYRLVINGTAIDIGDGRTPPDQPSFKNTLSSGDRSTLALAFFLARLENDAAIADKTVVFDDPFNSQDAFRRRQTVHEIVKMARRCAQVIVLSHDATFLKQVWDKTPAADRVALTLADHQAKGMKIMPVDLVRACQGRTDTDIDDLQAYANEGVGKPLDLIRKMRVVLETHLWTTYPAYFHPEQDRLGVMVGKIREGGDQHPAHDLYDDLEAINDYTGQYHHGENVADITPDQIDPVELNGFVRLTLRIVNALQA